MLHHLRDLTIIEWLILAIAATTIPYMTTETYAEYAQRERITEHWLPPKLPVMQQTAPPSSEKLVDNCAESHNPPQRTAHGTPTRPHTGRCVAILPALSPQPVQAGSGPG